MKQIDSLAQSTQLTRFLESNEYKGLSEIDKEIVIAINHVKIKDYSLSDLINSLIVLIGKTHLSCGIDIRKDGRTEVINATIEELASDLQKYNSGLTFKEIEIAFKNGYKGTYGDFMGLNNKTYFHWINSYQYGESRCKVIKMALNEKQMNKELSEQEKEQILKNGALKCFENYKKSNQIQDFGNVTYNYLVKSGQINYTKEIKDKIFAKAKQRLIYEKELELTKSISLFEIKEIKDAIRNIDSSQSLLISEAKKEALKQYFDNLVEMDLKLNFD